jgi:translation initiation factor IF-1
MRSGLIAIGTVLEVERSDFHVIALDGSPGRRVLARRSGWMYLKRISVAPGDRVRVDLCEADPKRGRIMRRL